MFSLYIHLYTSLKYIDIQPFSNSFQTCMLCTLTMASVPLNAGAQEENWLYAKLMSSDEAIQVLFGSYGFLL